MRTLHVLTLVLSAVLLCSAAPALGPITCSEGNGSATADVAVHQINEQHDHGYKFRLQEVRGNKVDQVDGGCNVELQLELRETKCHVINPKPFEDCEIREEHERAVMANCTVLMTVKDGGANVTKYQCDTQQVKMSARCPDCPILIALNSSAGLKSIHKAMNEVNKNVSDHHYYILKEVGRISSGYIMNSGMYYYAEFALVEALCPKDVGISNEACIPLCPDRARHAFCRSSTSDKDGPLSVKCDFYPASNTTALGPGEMEPLCRHRHGRRHSHGRGHGHRHPPNDGSGGPPPHGRDHSHGPLSHAGSGGPPPHARDHGHGPPPHAGRGGPPPHNCEHAHGPPPHARDHGHGPPPHAGSGGPPPHAHGKCSPFVHLHPCHGLLANADPALHPICPWPLPRPKNIQS